MVTVPDVATTVPDVLTVRTLAVNVSAPSVVESAVGVTEKLPALLVIVKLPLLVPKSPAFVTVQYNVVPSVTLVVVTLKVSELPSLTLFAAAETEYVGDGAGVGALPVGVAGGNKAVILPSNLNPVGVSWRV